MARVAIIAERLELDQPLQEALVAGGHESRIFVSSPQAALDVTLWSPELAIYDSALPFGPHEEALADIRRAIKAPLVVLMDGHNDWGVVRMLRLGADDCLGKPYSIGELLARVEAHLRRYWQWGEALTEYPAVDRHRPMAVVAENAGDDLSAMEQRLLSCLLERDGGVVTREELRRSLWSTGDRQVAESTLSLYIHQLRQKLESDPGRPWSIITKWGVGYYLLPRTPVRR